VSLRAPAATPVPGRGLLAGFYLLGSCEAGWSLIFKVSSGLGWEHVSVRAVRSAAKGKQQNRIPTWKEMCQVKSACWSDEDVVMQLHPAESNYIDVHPCVLHLWRPVEAAIPTPPLECV
jgi:hypothetical protein